MTFHSFITIISVNKITNLKQQIMSTDQFIQELQLKEILDEVFACELPQMFERFSPLAPKQPHEQLLGPLTTEEKKLLCVSILMTEGARKQLFEAMLWRHIFIRFGSKIPKNGKLLLRKEGVCLL